MRLGQGRENAKQYLRDNPALVEEIEKKVLEKRGLVVVAPTGQPEENGHGEEMPAPRGRRQPAATE